jgi:hypothetical protein
MSFMSVARKHAAAQRFIEHPATVLVITNLNYAEAPRLMPRDTQVAAALDWHEVKLSGGSAHEYAEQIEELGSLLARDGRRYGEFRSQSHPDGMCAGITFMNASTA